MQHKGAHEVWPVVLHRMYVVAEVGGATEKREERWAYWYPTELHVTLGYLQATESPGNSLAWTRLQVQRSCLVGTASGSVTEGNGREVGGTWLRSSLSLTQRVSSRYYAVAYPLGIGAGVGRSPADPPSVSAGDSTAGRSAVRPRPCECNDREVGGRRHSSAVSPSTTRPASPACAHREAEAERGRSEATTERSSVLV